MKDHRDLTAFKLADELAFKVYVTTRSWPDDERYGLTSQVRRGAVSVASNIVEGCGRSTVLDYHRFLVMAHSASRELEYQLSLAKRLNYSIDDSLLALADEACRVLAGLVKANSSLIPHSSSLKP